VVGNSTKQLGDRSMFTHAENFVLLLLAVVQGTGLAAFLGPLSETPDVIVIVGSLLVGFVVAAVEIAVIAKLFQR
jgi:uncharacterized membrane protein